MEETFSLKKLIYDIKHYNWKTIDWKNFEYVIYGLSRQQDTKCKRNKESSPDVKLSNGFGLEAKLISSTTRDINLNSAAPDPKTYYVIAHYSNYKIKDIAIISGKNFFSPEIEKIQKIDTSLRNLENKYLKYRTRVMWQLRSPFTIWGRGNYVVDEFGVKTIHA